MQQPLTLDRLLRGATDDNLPGEWDTGPAAGREIWRAVNKGVCSRQGCFSAQPMREIDVKDLRPLQGSAHNAPRPGLQKLTDDELLKAVRNPARGDVLTENTRTGTLIDGNGRAHELFRRAADPNSSIKPDTKVPVAPYTPDMSMSPDVP